MILPTKRSASRSTVLAEARVAQARRPPYSGSRRDREAAVLVAPPHVPDRHMGAAEPAVDGVFRGVVEAAGERVAAGDGDAQRCGGEAGAVAGRRRTGPRHRWGGQDFDQRVRRECEAVEPAEEQVIAEKARWLLRLRRGE